MSGPHLSSLTVENFRSIRGRISVDLDAPVVLIHGNNGAGKTSLLSAIELALTGQVQSLRSAEPEYERQLCHKLATSGAVTLSVSAEHGSLAQHRVDVSGEGVAVLGRRSAIESRFFSERCYLAQSTLSRLLELYQLSDARKSDSPLTSFVKELLGLDHLDALVEGLRDAGDVRRIRTAVPEYANLRDDIAAEARVRETLVEEHARLDASIAESRTALAERLRALEMDPESSLVDIEALHATLDNRDEEVALKRVAATRRDVAVMLELWNSALSASARVDEKELTAGAERARTELSAWEGTTGRELRDILEEFARQGIAFRQSYDLTGSALMGLARSTLSEELARAQAVLDRQVQMEGELEAARREAQSASARSELLADQLRELSSDAGGLAAALAAIAPHVSGGTCPVCERNFGEVSAGTLHEHLAAKIESLTLSARRLQELSQQRLAAESELAVAARRRDALTALLMTADERDNLKTRRARCLELTTRLSTISDDLVLGDLIKETAAESARALEEWKSKQKVLDHLTKSLADLLEETGLPTAASDESFELTCARLHDVVTAREESLSRRQEIRTRALEDLQRLVRVTEKHAEVGVAVAESRARHERMTKALGEADTRVLQLRALAREAREVRTTIVRRVFNESLNSLWRDLFVRLAPEEPFIPSFALPELSSGPVEAVLETVYRGGGRGGNPRAMLSAGNLNTAALTLFLALHLSVAPTLPWLVIDDPVQSMDEVHISQFAALLRTLSKQHNRQIVLAVHERPLFEYLALELSPAFPGDRLITIELSRSAEGDSMVNYEPHVWAPDPAVAA